MIPHSITISQPHICSAFCIHQGSQVIPSVKSLRNKVSAIAFKAMDPLKRHRYDPKQSCEHEDFSVAQFIRFLKRIKLKKLLFKIKDPRQNRKINYTSDVILYWALSVYFFRQRSCNGLQTSLKKLKPKKRTAILNYLGLKDKKDSFPHRTVVSDCLKHIEADEVNGLLIHLFNWAKRNKIFSGSTRDDRRRATGNT